MTIAELLDALWRDYASVAPQAERIHQLLAARGETLRNDHVALRTFGVPEIGLTALAATFESLGWRPRDTYRFDDKHLRARYWQHDDPALPKVFVSELVLAELSPAAQAVVAGLVAQLPAGFGARPDLAWAGRPWALPLAAYETLLAESEYAAWVAAFGFRVNHFTVDVASLASFPGLVELNAFLVAHGFTLNDAGGAIKGTPRECLEQSSTRADSIEVAFSDRTARIPSCYYEFARRYPLPSGELFSGFVPASAGDRAGQRREVIVELEQHVDIDADELHAHAPVRILGAGPSRHGGEREDLIRRRQGQLEREGRARGEHVRGRDERASDADVARLRLDPRDVRRASKPHGQDAAGTSFATKMLPALVARTIHPASRIAHP
jgi:hypothetical protein